MPLWGMLSAGTRIKSRLFSRNGLMCAPATRRKDDCPGGASDSTKREATSWGIVCEVWSAKTDGGERAQPVAASLFPAQNVSRRSGSAHHLQYQALQVPLSLLPASGEKLTNAHSRERDRRTVFVCCERIETLAECAGSRHIQQRRVGARRGDISHRGHARNR